MFVSISGMIGAGKTTLANELGPVLGLPVHEEGVIDNLYLERFYRNMKQYSFPLQVYLLNRRFVQQQKIVWNDKGGVQDRSIYEDLIFAKVLHEIGEMEREDYETYLALFRNMSRFMSHPSLIVYLRVTPEESMARIKARSRGCETTITLEYLQKLYKGYEDFHQEISKTVRVIVVPWSEFHDTEKVAEAIRRENSQMRSLRTVHLS